MNKGWIGVDLDGTLAEYDSWKGPTHIGAPVPAMQARVLRWLSAGIDVRIMTARVASREPCEVLEVTDAINQWCLENLGTILPVTCQKDYSMIELWDDRVVQVEENTGRPVAGSKSRFLY